jgi:hypothetical protein
MMPVEHVGVRGRKRLDDNWSLGPSRELAQQAFGPARELEQLASDPAQELAQPVLGSLREFACDSSGIFRCIFFKNLTVRLSVDSHSSYLTCLPIVFIFKRMFLYFRMPSGCASVLQVITRSKNYDRIKHWYCAAEASFCCPTENSHHLKS